MFVSYSWVRGFAFVSLLLAVAACGGGGGGDGGANSFSVTLDRSAITFNQYEGASPSSQVITGTIHGSYNGSLFVAAIVENTGGTNAINPNIPLSVSATQATAVITPASNLTAGVYTGRVLFLACSDQACNNRIGGTPLPVNFTVNVLTPARANPSSLTQTVVSGTTAVQDFVVTLGLNETGFTVSNSFGSPAQVSDQSDSGFRLTLPSLPVGNYSYAVTVTGSNGSRSTIPISYTVTVPEGGEHGLVVGPPSSLAFSTMEGANSSAQILPVTEPSWLPGLMPPVVEYVQGQNWLQVTPVSNGYSITANASQLSSGTYTARLLVQSNPVANSYTEPLSIPVSLTVGPGLVRPGDINKIIEAETTLADLTGTIDINVAGGPQVTWNAVSDVAWLTVSPSGLTGAPLIYQLDPAFLASAGNYSESVATVTVTAPGSPHTPVSFRISALPRLPEVSGVGAHIQQAGQATTLIVAGRGFGAITSPAQRISVTGNSPTSVQRAHDGKLLVTFTGLAPGTHTVSLSNELGISTSTGSVVAVTPNAHSYATVPIGRHIQALVMDHQTETLYAVSYSDTDGHLFRFNPSGNGWGVNSVAMNGGYNLGVLHAGDVVVKTSPGTIRMLDGITLVEKYSQDLSCIGFDALSSGGIPVTLDGRMWLAQVSNIGCAGTPMWGKIGTFDPIAREFDASPFGENSILSGQYFDDGPDFLMSRNGERLVVHPHQGLGSGYNTIAYVDISESIPRSVNDTPSWTGAASISDDGHRMLFDSDRVLDMQFKVVGRVVIPDYTMPTVAASSLASVVSPDGTRAYVLTARSSDLNQASTTYLPRVYVLDISGDIGDSAVPVLGYFELPDYPSCLSDVSNCGLRVPSAISLDGKTLYFAGRDRLIITPVATALQTVNAQNTNAAAAGNVRLWRSSVAQ